MVDGDLGWPLELADSTTTQRPAELLEDISGKIEFKHHVAGWVGHEQVLSLPVNGDSPGAGEFRFAFVFPKVTQEVSTGVEHHYHPGSPCPPPAETMFYLGGRARGLPPRLDR